jgi:hypothetical protein
MRQKDSSDIVFEEVSIDVTCGAFFQDQMLPNLHTSCLETPVKSRGILRCHHIRGKTRAPCRNARYDRNVFYVPRYSMVNVVSGHGSRLGHLLRFSVFPIGYCSFIKTKYQVNWTALECFVHTAYCFVEEYSPNLQTRIFSCKTFLLGQFRGIT